MGRNTIVAIALVVMGLCDLGVNSFSLFNISYDPRGEMKKDRYYEAVADAGRVLANLEVLADGFDKSKQNDFNYLRSIVSLEDIENTRKFLTYKPKETFEDCPTCKAFMRAVNIPYGKYQATLAKPDGDKVEAEMLYVLEVVDNYTRDRRSKIWGTYKKLQFASIGSIVMLFTCPDNRMVKHEKLGVDLFERTQVEVNSYLDKVYPQMRDPDYAMPVVEERAIYSGTVASRAVQAVVLPELDNLKANKVDMDTLKQRYNDYLDEHEYKVDCSPFGSF